MYGNWLLIVTMEFILLIACKVLWESSAPESLNKKIVQKKYNVHSYLGIPS